MNPEWSFLSRVDKEFEYVNGLKGWYSWEAVLIRQPTHVTWVKSLDQWSGTHSAFYCDVGPGMKNNTVDMIFTNRSTLMWLPATSNNNLPVVFYFMNKLDTAFHVPANLGKDIATHKWCHVTWSIRLRQRIFLF